MKFMIKPNKLKRYVVPAAVPNAVSGVNQFRILYYQHPSMSSVPPNSLILPPFSPSIDARRGCDVVKGASFARILQLSRASPVGESGRVEDQYRILEDYAGLLSISQSYHTTSNVSQCP